jgi:sec-independent protein translocase protein TatC
MKDTDKEIDDSTAPLIEHLAELRTRLINSLVAFCVAMILGFAVAGPVFNFLASPLARLLLEHGQQPELIYTGLQQGFMVRVRISVFAGFVMAFPIIAYQLWRFVAPGLYRREKRAFLPFLVASPALFLIGGAFAFYVVLPIAFDFFLSFQQFGAGPLTEAADPSVGGAVPPPGGADAVPGGAEAAAGGDQALSIQYLGTINEYLGLTMKFIIAFGLCFQLPVLLTLMGKAGLVSSAGLVGFRRYAIVVILIIAAVATPPDVMSQLILFAAVYPLYEISIFLVRIVERRREAELRAEGLWDEEVDGAKEKT